MERNEKDNVTRTFTSALCFNKISAISSKDLIQHQCSGVHCNTDDQFEFSTNKKNIKLVTDPFSSLKGRMIRMGEAVRTITIREVT